MCLVGLFGRNCESDVDECLLYIFCKNGVFCINMFGGYVCVCLLNWLGKNCIEDIDECFNELCNGYGNCLNIFGFYICFCDVGWNGIYCNRDIDECVLYSLC